MFKNIMQNYNFFTEYKKIYEDEQSIVLEELSSREPLHLLVVPKMSISILCNALPDDKKQLGHLILIANKIAKRRGFEGNSYHITIDEDLQSGNINSIHIIGKVSKPILWPITPNSRL